MLSRSSQEIKEKTDVLPNIAKEAIDVKLRCQFCLEHLESNPKIFLDVELKKSFTELTQRMVGDCLSHKTLFILNLFIA